MSNIRWTGAALLVAGLLFAIGIVLHPPDEFANFSTSAWGQAHWMVVASSLLALVGLGGLFAHVLKDAGALGLAAYALFTIGQGVVVAIAGFEAGIVPALVGATADAEGLLAETGPIFGGPFATLFMVLTVGIGLGGLLTAWTLYRRKHFSQIAAGLLGVGAPLFVLSVVFGLDHLFVQVFGVAYGVGLAWVGYGLWGEASG